jgi:hypothetical protein
MPRDRVSGLFWLTVAGAASLHGLTLKLGSLDRPGPGFFPFWGGVVLGLLSLVLLVTSRETPGTEAVSGRGPIRLLVVAGALLGYLGFLETLGFTTVTFLFLLLLFRLAGKGWTFSAAAALAGAAAAYALFQLWLKTQLPAGPFGF